MIRRHGLLMRISGWISESTSISITVRRHIGDITVSSRIDKGYASCKDGIPWGLSDCHTTLAIMWLESELEPSHYGLGGMYTE